MAWLFPLTLLAFAVVGAIALLRSLPGYRRGLADLKAALAARGLVARRPPGSPAPSTEDAVLLTPMLGVVLERGDGARVTRAPLVGAGSVPVPGFGIGVPLTLVELPLALPDQLICTPARAQAAFGPFPPPPVPSGHPGFDRQFGIYLRPDATPSYRGGPVDAAPWAHRAHAAPLVQALLGLGFEALHVQTGQGRAVFPQLSIDGMVRALDASAGFARSVPVSAAAASTELKPASGGAIAVLVGGLLPTMGGFIVIGELARNGSELAGATVACPEGGQYRPSFKSRAASCTAAHGASLPVSEGAYQAWGTLAASSYFLGLLLVSAALWRRAQTAYLRAITARLAQA